MKRTKFTLFLLLILFTIVSCIHPLYPKEQLLQHLGTVILLSVLLSVMQNNNISLLAYFFFSAYIFIHVLGARYIYTYVPYEKWFSTIAGIISDSTFEITGRNQYDRFVHLASGILLFPIIFESIGKNRQLPKNFVIMITWFTIQSIGMLYEVFEWLLTLVLSTEAANDYNGQQGDLWDAQKDMFLALAGSSIMAVFYFFGKTNGIYTNLTVKTSD